MFLEDAEMKLRLLIATSGYVRVSDLSSSATDLSTLKITNGESVDVSGWLVFRRKILSRMAPSAVVLIDEKPGRMHLTMSLRVRCMSCRGVASNRGLCGHEVKCVVESGRNSGELSSQDEENVSR